MTCVLGLKVLLDRIRHFPDKPFTFGQGINGLLIRGYGVALVTRWGVIGEAVHVACIPPN